MSLNGFDISNYQKGIQLGYLNFDFVIIKATQGINYVSPSFETQIQQAFNLNKLIGVYHYISHTDYKAEATFFLNKIQKYLGRVLICVDWEADMNASWGNGAYITNFLNFIYNSTGIKPVLYMSKSVCRESYWNSYKSIPETYDTWLAQYPNYDIVTAYNPKPWTDNKGYGMFKNPIIFQYASKGQLPGYSGFLDLDICYLTKDEWTRRCKKQATGSKNTYTVTANTLNIREGSSSSTKDIGDLKKGSVITVDKIENGFAHFEGWCSVKYLE